MRNYIVFKIPSKVHHLINVCVCVCVRACVTLYGYMRVPTKTSFLSFLTVTYYSLPSHSIPWR